MIYAGIDRDPIWLEHHGILGQKWHHRNGPPYPLGSAKGSERSAKEKRLNPVQKVVEGRKSKNISLQEEAVSNLKRKTDKSYNDYLVQKKRNYASKDWAKTIAERYACNYIQHNEILNTFKTTGSGVLRSAKMTSISGISKGFRLTPPIDVEYKAYYSGLDNIKSGKYDSFIRQYPGLDIEAAYEYGDFRI